MAKANVGWLWPLWEWAVLDLGGAEPPGCLVRQSGHGEYHSKRFPDLCILCSDAAKPIMKFNVQIFDVSVRA
jgi:hypothetical protein